MLFRVFILIAVIGTCLPIVHADAGGKGTWGDQGDGTYTNPILPADYSDPDVIRVGSDYYMVSSTIQLSGGVVLLHPRDLVNWTTSGYVVVNTADLFHSDDFNYSGMNLYGKGIMAPALRYHNNTFYVFFETLDKNGGTDYVCTAPGIAGPWKVRQMKDKNGADLTGPGFHWYDQCPFWDDDGKAYLVMSHSYPFKHPCLFQMSTDGLQLLDGDVNQMRLNPSTATATIPGQGTSILPSAPKGEANKIYKMRGYYYLFHNETVNNTSIRIAVMARSRNLYGTKPDGTPGKPGDPGLYDMSPQGTRYYAMVQGVPIATRYDQGALIDSPDGKKFLTHQGKGECNGRQISLLPVTWIDDWPMAGTDAKNDRITMPVLGQAISFPQGRDDFNSSTLDAKWQWNYQPRADMWSLTGTALRLKAFKPLAPGNFFQAGNTICQRYVKGDSAQADVKIIIANMADGEEAGFVHFNGGSSYCTIGVLQTGGTRTLKYNNNGNVIHGPNFAGSTIYYRTAAYASANSTFYYSSDGMNFTQLGGVYALKWGGYCGDYISIYNYNNETEAGSIEVDWFRYRFSGQGPASSYL